MEYMKTILLDLNSKLPPSQHGIEYWEFLRWIGIWFLLATVEGHARTDFWDESIDDRRFGGAPFTVNDIMSETRFQFITKSLYYTRDARPNYVDEFHVIRGLQGACNTNMLFIAGWLICLDELMSKWMNQWTCPGIVFCPRKPWPFGNEWHTIACSICTIVFFVELVEGKDRPSEAPPREFNDKSKTVGLVLRMTRPIWHRAKCVILDSGFGVLKAIVELQKKGVYASAVVKKRRYWPKYVDGDAIRKHFEDKDVGTSEAQAGSLDGVDSICFV